MNVVSNECGLKRMWSQMNWSQLSAHQVKQQTKSQLLRKDTV